ncbi:MAG TPA: hypothetical protein VF292_14725 [Rhodanobacteraceae bacterium]
MTKGGMAGAGVGSDRCGTRGADTRDIEVRAAQEARVVVGVVRDDLQRKARRLATVAGEGQQQPARAVELGAAERAQIIFAPDQVGDVELAAHARDCTVEDQRVFDDHTKSAVLSETLDAQGDSWAVRVSVNARHLVDALHALDAEKVTLQVAEGGAAVQIQGANDVTSMQILVAQPAP